MRPGQLVETTAPIYASRRLDLGADLTRLPARSVGVVREAELGDGAPYLLLAFQARQGRLFARVAPWLVELVDDD